MPDGDRVLTRIADDDAHLRDIVDLGNATSDRLLAENHLSLLPGISVEELVFDVPGARIINAAFCHAHPQGSRFNGPERGAWYAAFEIETAQAEVIHHKTIALAEIDYFDDSLTYEDYLADFAGVFHDLRNDVDHADCLVADSYVASQSLGERLLQTASLGLVYPSVRRAGGTNLVCFRPAMVTNVRLRSTYRITWSGAPEPTVEQEQVRRPV